MKKLYISKCAAGLALLLLALTRQTAAQSSVSLHSDTQQWNDVQFYVPLNKQIDFVLLGTLRIGRDISHPVDERIGAGFAFKVGKYLTVLPNYLHITTQPFRGLSLYENRLSVQATVRKPLGKFTLSDRNLFERRLRHPGGDSTRYRNRLQIEHPLLVKEKLNLFVSDEIFYDWRLNDWVRNRFQVGVSKVFNKHFTLDLYYLRQNDGRSLRGNLNVIGTTWRLR